MLSKKLNGLLPLLGHWSLRRVYCGTERGLQGTKSKLKQIQHVYDMELGHQTRDTFYGGRVRVVVGCGGR